jgi:hypothetical protein
MKTKKMADGGGTGYPTPPTYPFYGNQLTPNNTAPNGNIQPASQPMQPMAALQPTQMNEGGLTKEEKRAHEDAKNRKKEENAPTTKSGMGDDRIDMDTLKKGYEKLKDLIKGKAKGGTVKMAKGGSVRSSASRRGDGIAQRGKTKGRMV